MGSLFGRRREEGPLVLVCGRQPAAFCVYQCVNTELTVRQPKTGKQLRERNKKQSDGTEEH